MTSGAGDGEDEGFLPEEAFKTAGRLARSQTTHKVDHSHSRPNLLRPAHYADLRTVPTAAEGELSGNQIKLGLPPALLRSFGTAPAVLAESVGAYAHAKEQSRTKLDALGAARRGGARLRLGEKFRRTSTQSLDQPAAAAARAAARAAAAERLSIKHSTLKARATPYELLASTPSSPKSRIDSERRWGMGGSSISRE